MANRKQLAILKQGVEVWNKWREENPDAKIDLRGAKLDELDLSGANFSKADICSANFYKKILIKTNFSWAILDCPYFSDFYEIKGVNFKYSNLSYAIFDNTVFIDQSGFINNNQIQDYFLFEGAILDYFSLKGSTCCTCRSFIFRNSQLDDKRLIELLVYGFGYNVFLKGTNLKRTRLVNFDLRGVDLRETNLLQANLSGADITGAKLYGSARENWIIDGIRCEYVYWDEAGEQRTPPDRDFRLGEFEELYRQLPTFEYFFEQGITPLDTLIMSRVVEAINERHREFFLELVSYDKRGEPHATFTVCHLDYVEKAKEQLAVGYEQNRIEPERQDQLMKIISKLIDNNAMMAGNQSKSLDIIKQLGDAAMRDKYSITVGNGGQVGGIGDHAAVSGNTFQQVIYSNDFQLNISDLSRLHEAMRNTAASPEQKAAAEDVAKAEQAARQQDEPTMRQHLKNAGKFALDCAKDIGTEALAQYLKKITVG